MPRVISHWSLSESGWTLTKRPASHLIAVVATFRSSNNKVQWIARNLETKEEVTGYRKSVVIAQEMAHKAMFEKGWLNS